MQIKAATMPRMNLSQYIFSSGFMSSAPLLYILF